MKQITASQGDTWDKISYDQFGSEFYVTELMLVNGRYTDTIIFSGGEVLNIPDISVYDTDSLPPWRK